MSEEKEDLIHFDTEEKNENQWIDELRSAIERDCDLGVIRNIGKCRPLPDDLRLAIWKVGKTFDYLLSGKLSSVYF